MEYPIIDAFINAYLRNHWTGLGSAGRLPAGYQEVEYIYSSPDSPAQTFRPSFYITPTSVVEIKVKLNEYSMTQGFAFIGEVLDPPGYFLLGGNAGNGNWILQYQSFGFFTTPSKNTDINTFVFDVSNKTLSINGNSVEASNIDNTLSTKYYPTVFSYNGSERFTAMNFYELKHYDNGVLTNHVIPCYKTENNEAGAYDIITNEFYPNIGLGSFGAGPDVSGGVNLSDFVYRLSLPIMKCYPLVDALIRAGSGDQTAEDTEILRHYLTPLGIGGI